VLQGRGEDFKMGGGQTKILETNTYSTINNNNLFLCCFNVLTPSMGGGHGPLPFMATLLLKLQKKNRFITLK